MRRSPAPRPKVSGLYISSAFGGATMNVPPCGPSGGATERASGRMFADALARSKARHSAHGPDERRSLKWMQTGASYFREVVRSLVL